MSVAKVGDIAKQVRGISYSKADATAQQDAGLVPILRANNITENGLAFSNLVYVPDKYVRPNQYIQRGDVVIAASSGSLDVVGKAGEARTDFRGSFGAFCKILRPDQQKVDLVYFAHFFKTTAYRRKISSLAAGANINNLKNEHLDDLEIPLPPLDEQKRIAGILDEADALRTKRRQAIALLDSLTQSIFLEMFGDPMSNPRGYPIRELQDIVHPERKITYGILMPGPDVPDGIAYVRVVDIQGGAVLTQQLRRTTREIATEYRRSELKAGDLLISIRGHVGRMAIAPLECDGANITQDTARLAITGADPHFVSAVLAAGSSQHWMDRRTKGVAVRGINLGDLKRFPVILPPADLQRQFAAKVEQQGRLMKQCVTQATEADALFASLQHSAFSGQL